MTEITEIDMNKYFVLKREDLDRFFSQYTKGIFTTIDTFELWWVPKIPRHEVKVSDIAVALVNAILKAKEKT